MVGNMSDMQAEIRTKATMPIRPGRNKATRLKRKAAVAMIQGRREGEIRRIKAVHRNRKKRKTINDLKVLAGSRLGDSQHPPVPY